MRVGTQRPSGTKTDRQPAAVLCQMGDGRSAERMKRGDELNGVGRNGFSDCALAREAGQGRNGEDVELQSEEFLRALVVLIRRNGSVVAVVHPHACGGGLGDVSVMEVVREL